MGHNSPMAIKNFSDKLEFQGRGAAHIHGCAWCDLSKVYEVLNLKSNIVDNEEEYESESEDDNENMEELEDDVLNSENNLEKAFQNMRKKHKN